MGGGSICFSGRLRIAFREAEEALICMKDMAPETDLGHMYKTKIRAIRNIHGGIRNL